MKCESFWKLFSPFVCNFSLHYCSSTPSLLPSGKFYLRFWIIILQKMLEWQRRSDKSLSESLGKFVIICTLTLSPGGEICRGTGTAILLSPLFLIILFHNNCKICVSSSAQCSAGCPALLRLLLPYFHICCVWANIPIYSHFNFTQYIRFSYFDAVFNI